MTRVRVCHITSAHIPLDGRIFYHECKSLAELYDVTLVCASNEPSRTVDGVHIVSAAPRSGGRAARWRRMGTLTQAAEETSARIFHFHDPELLPHMVRLGRATGSPVVYDVHEHYPDAVMQRAWVPAHMRTAVSKIADRTERRHAPQCDAVVCADEALVERFAGMSVRRPVLVRNFPTAGMGATNRSAHPHPTVAYVGSISAARGFHEILHAFELVREKFPEARLTLIGSPTEEVEEALAEVALSRTEVSYLGPRPYGELPELLAGIDVGLALLRDDPKYYKNVPTKVFDYMAAGIPFVASDFPPLRALVGTGAGLLVPPGDARKASEAILMLLSDPDTARVMGDHGRREVETHLNWDSEKRRLLALYESLLARDGGRGSDDGRPAGTDAAR